MLLGPSAHQPGGEESPRVTCTLACADGAVEPGEVTWLAVTFEIADGWHIYWPGQNDTGMTPSFRWKLPEGWQLGRPRWPAPMRHLAPGDLLDHVLEGQVTVLFPLRVSEDAPTDPRAQISCQTQWLVCDEMCLRENARLETRFQVVSSKSETNEPLPRAFARAFEALPKPLDERSPVSAELSEAGSLVLQATGSGELVFCPAQDGRAPSDILDGCVSDSGKLVVKFREQDVRPVEGVVTFRADAGQVQHFVVRFPEISSRELDGFDVEDSSPKPRTEENLP